MVIAGLRTVCDARAAGLFVVCVICPATEDPAEQLEDFKRLAREIGADQDTDGDEVMKRLPQQKRRADKKRV